VTEYEFIQAEKARFPGEGDVQGARGVEVRLLRAAQSWPFREAEASR
jgi:hypothetical protein